MWRDASEYKTDAIRSTIIVLILVVCLNAIDPFIVNSTSKEHEIGQNMLENANEWYNLSLQDQNIQIKYRHISLASAYLNAARYVVDDATLGRLTKIDVHELHKAIDDKQKVYSKEMTRKCPKLKETPIVPSSIPKVQL